MITLPQPVYQAISEIQNAGFEAYAVGGCVRDSLMGKTPFDWDLTTSARPEKIIEIFSDQKVIPTGIKHGTVTVIHSGLPLEITTYRIDGVYNDSRRPENVTFSQNLADDLVRRDFTVNAMAYNPASGLIDLYGGVCDLNAKTLRAVGDPEARFTEDALRIMRAIRFAATLNFKIQESTSLALFSCRHLLKHIAAERIASELNKTLTAANSHTIMAKYFPIIAQRLFCDGLDSNISHQELSTVFTPLSGEENNLQVRLALFLHGAAQLYKASPYELGKKFFSYMKYANNTSHGVLVCLQNLDLPLTDNRIFLRKLLSSMGSTSALQLLQIKSALSHTPREYTTIRETLEAIILDGDCCHIGDLDISGSDLMLSLGYNGKQIGDALNLLLDAVIENRCENKKDKLLQFLK